MARQAELEAARALHSSSSCFRIRLHAAARALRLRSSRFRICFPANSLCLVSGFILVRESIQTLRPSVDAPHNFRGSPCLTSVKGNVHTERAGPTQRFREKHAAFQRSVRVADHAWLALARWTRHNVASGEAVRARTASFASKYEPGVICNPH